MTPEEEAKRIAAAIQAMREGEEMGRRLAEAAKSEAAKVIPQHEPEVLQARQKGNQG